MPRIQFQSLSNSQEIPLQKIDMSLDICNQVNQVTINQTYMNNDTHPIEAYYTFPVQANSSAYDFTAKIGDKIVKTTLKEKGEAKQEYNKAISDGHGAFLMERIEGDIFSVCLGNVPSKTEVLITIKYVVELKTEIDSTAVRITLPMTIMPRYTPSLAHSNEVISQDSLVNSLKVDHRPYTMHIIGSVFMQDGIISLDSKTTKIKIFNMKEKSLHFEMTNLENLDSDIILTVNRNKPTSGMINQKAENLFLTNEIYRHVTMVNLIPDFSQIPKTNLTEIHYTLIIDRSGSMEGQDFVHCKEAAKFFVSLLPIGSSFDIYHFGSDFEKFNSGQSINLASVLLKQMATKWIDDIRCSGGTEIYPVLVDAYQSIKRGEKSGAIILLTDGGISNVNEVLRLVKSNQEVNVFTIGIGQSVSQQLVQGMADEGNGKAEFVDHSGSQLQSKVISQLKKAETSIRRYQKDNSININVEGEYKMIPEKVPTLYENDVNTFYVLSQNPVKSMTYTQKLESYDRTINLPLETVNYEGYPIHRMAGVKLLESLYHHKEGSQIPHLKEDPMKNEIISVSQNLGILSKHTSFVGVEYREGKDKTTEKATFKEIPLQVAHKYQYCEPSGSTASAGSMGAQGHVGHTGPMGAQGHIGHIGSCGPRGSYKNTAADCLLIDPNPFSVNKGSTSTNASFGCDEECFDTGFDGGTSHLSFATPKYRGINTISSSLRNGSYDIRTSSFPAWPQQQKFDMNTNLPNPFLRNTTESTNYWKPTFQETRGTQEKKTCVSYMITLTLTEKLPPYIKLSDHILTSVTNSTLPFADKIKANDYISIQTGNSEEDGIYKVLSLGSNESPWVLEKILE
jgi:Vault protein inter-alpha-trypsin domain/von Willebrand factor type A domain